MDQSNDSVNKERVMLTTLDNPYNPFTQFEEWNGFDQSKGYYTCAFLARVATSSDELSKEDEATAIEEAIDEIVKENILGIYLKVTKEGFKDRSKDIPRIE